MNYFKDLIKIFGEHFLFRSCDSARYMYLVSSHQRSPISTEIRVFPIPVLS